MKLFQILSLVLLGGLTFRELQDRGTAVRRGRWLRTCLLMAASVAIAWPQTTQWLAVSLGIDRGADLVHYLGVLAFMGVAFQLYARNFALEQQLTELVRQQAIAGARFHEEGEGSPRVWQSR